MHNQIEFAKRVVEVVNDIIKNDPTLAQAAFTQEWPCNTWTIDHTEIKIDPKHSMVRMTGILNGIVGTLPDGTSLVRAVFKDKKLLRLELNTDGK